MKTALIVDDTKNIRTMLSQCLELEGYEVDSATNGLEGYEVMKDRVYDLVFLDIKLPEISGTELLRRVKKNGNPSSVIVMTAYPTIKNAVECTKLGAKAYLQKPFTADRLRTLLKELDLSEGGTKLKIDEAALLLEQERVEESLEILKACLSKEPENPMVYALLSRAYEMKGSTELSLKFAKTAELFTTLDE